MTSSGNLDHNHYSQSTDSVPSHQTLFHHSPPSFDLPVETENHDGSPLSPSTSFLQTPSSMTVFAHAAPQTSFPPTIYPATISGPHEEASNRTPVRSSAGHQSPDPHDFYRQLHDPFALPSPAFSGPIDPHSERERLAEDMATITTTRRSKLSLNDTKSIAPTSPLHIRKGNRTNDRMQPIKQDSRTRMRSPEGKTPARTSHNSRQSSLQDLVNRFNQIKDETLPASTNPRKRSVPDGRGSPIGAARARAALPRNADTRSPLHAVNGSRTASDHSGPPIRVSPQSAKAVYAAISPRVSPRERSIKAERNRTDIAQNPPAYHSLTSLHLSQNEAVIQPLFGELVGPTPGSIEPGHGIPSYRRRGSDGSSNFPTPTLHRRSRSERELSPSSPDAWYLRPSPPLGPGAPEREPASAMYRRPHRRTMSEFAGDPTIPADVSGLSINSLMALPTPASSPKSTDRSSQRRQTLSRIPVSSRRASTSSVSGASCPSTRSNSAMGTPTAGRLSRPPRGHNTTPEPHRKAFTRDAVRPVTPAQLDPLLQVISPTKTPGMSPRLKAYVTAPMPKKSPPLRSSRPRQPVSSATTSASRGKVVQRYDPQQSIDRAISRQQRAKEAVAVAERSAKPKHIPELGTVDFAARRERIQRAFTVSLREKERKDEDESLRRLERRRAKDQERQERAAGRLSIHSSSSRETGPAQPRETTPKKDPLRPTHVTKVDLRDAETRPRHVRKQSAKRDRILSIDTQLPTQTLGHEASAARHGIDLVDSPTLGMPGSFPTAPEPGLGMTPAELPSAVTAETETETTPIDPEPYTEPAVVTQARTSPRHRRALSQIFQPREVMSERALQAKEYANELSPTQCDETQTIPIMLGHTPVHERFGEAGTPEESSMRTTDDLAAEPMGSRWSLDSFRSYARPSYFDRERDSDLDRTDRTVASSESTRGTSVERDWHAWRAEEGLASRSGHTTLDSEGYNTINKVLEQYHNPSFVSLEMSNDFQKHILTKSPELARQGGWDPKRVTQLYLQELGRGKSMPRRPSHGDSVVAATSPGELTQFSTQQSPTTAGTSSGTSIIPQTGTAEEWSDLSRLKSESRYRPPNPTWSAIQADLEVPELDSPVRHRASLTGRDDWTDTSPSIVDWIHPQAANSPEEEKQMDFSSAPPPKGQDSSGGLPLAGPRSRSSLQASDRSDAHTPRLGSVIPPGLPELESIGGGLGLVLQVDASVRDEPAAHAAPPSPAHSPPPIPLHTRQPSYDPFRNDSGLRSPPSPSIYSRNPMSSPSLSIVPDGTMYKIRVLEQESVTPESHSHRPSTLVKVRSASRSAPSRQAHTEVQSRRASATATAANSAAPTAEQKRLTKRRFIIKELLDTEKQFHGDMKVTEEIYKGTSNACSAVSAEDVKILFGNIEQIVRFSLEFFDSLRQAAASVYVVRKITALTSSKRSSVATGHSGDGSGFGDCGAADADDSCASSLHLELTDKERDKETFIGEAFGRHMAQIEKVYSEYLRNLEAANQRLTRLQQTPSVVLWLNECQSHAEDLTDTWSLDSLLVKPMQRILKYPLLLQALSAVTPDDHPDFTAVDGAMWEMKAVTNRIEELMKRVDLMEQAVGRKRKESDVRTGISKAFGRRTEKLRQQVGLSEMFDDIDFNRVAEKWDAHVIQLQFAMADVDKYLGEVQRFADRFLEFVTVIEQFLDLARPCHPDLESRWRRLGKYVRELSGQDLAHHKALVQRTVIDPMRTLVRMYDGPQKIIQKRNKRIMDYARYKGVKDRGDRPDKRLQEQGEQFMALNETLKEELPRLYGLTGKLGEACLANLIQTQVAWYGTWQDKLRRLLDRAEVPRNVSEVMRQFATDFPLAEAPIHSLGICNGSMLADTVNLLGLAGASVSAAEGRLISSRPGSLPGSRNRTRSVNSHGNGSPVTSTTEFVKQDGSGFMPAFTSGMGTAAGPTPSAMSYAVNRMRANSSQSYIGAPSLTPDLSSNTQSIHAMTPATSSANSTSNGQARHQHHSYHAHSHTNQVHPAPVRPSTSTGRSLDLPGDSHGRSSEDPSPAVTRPASGSTSYSVTGDSRRPSSPSIYGRPFSGLFSSAMPMMDSPRSSPRASRSGSPGPPMHPAHVLFTCASIEGFNLGQSRKEAGYPYLTYTTGEIFDVIGEKGELWLAMNQDDRSQIIGWLWCKHFVKVD